MTPEEVRQSVERIRGMAADDEMAHSAEDTLHQDVLHAIATGTAENPGACAHAALQTQKIHFNRWCA